MLQKVGIIGELEQATVVIEANRLEETQLKLISELSGVIHCEPVLNRSGVSCQIYVYLDKSDAVLSLSIGGSIVSLHKELESKP
jgi:hypothetical protein